MAQVGGKAGALGQMIEAGFPVPGGCVILPTAFNENGLMDAAWANIQLYLDRWRTSRPDITFAVRSSGKDEDGANAAFAGEFATVLNVSRDEAIGQAIEAVYASRHQAQAYRQAHGLAGSQSMAVIIQQFIPAECAGVALSVDPVGPDHARLVVNAAWGLGPGVVEGTVPADTYWLRRHDLSLATQIIATKDRRIVPFVGGVGEATVPNDQHAVPCLPPNWLARIGQYTLALEQFFGEPQDVEWAIAGGQVWVLQSRPITALAAQACPVPFPIAWEDEADRSRFWSLWELAPHPVLWPLEKDQLDRLSLSRGELRRHEGRDFIDRAWVCNGRVYRGGGVPNPEPPDQRQRRRTELAELDTRLHAEGSSPWEHYRPAIVAAAERLGRFDARHATGSALAAHLEEALAVYEEHCVLHGLVWSSAAAFWQAYDRVTGAASSEAAARPLLVGEETVLTRLVDALYALGVSARASPTVARLVEDPPADAMARLAAMPEAADFRSQLGAFLQVYGDRNGMGAGSEGTLCMPTLREQPEAVLRLIAPYLDERATAPAVARQRSRAARDALLEALCAACPEAEAVAEFRREWQWAVREAVVLEDHNHYIDQLASGQLRTAVLHAARWLCARGRLPDVDSVFWLTFADILAALRTGVPKSFTALIAARQAQNAAWEQLVPPPFLGLPPKDLAVSTSGGAPPAAVAPPDSPPLLPNQRLGLGVSAGQATGRARLLQPGDVNPDIKPGDILVARAAGPLWTPFFPILGGVVLEYAAIGQHAAATAREYGLPAVINCRDLMLHIHDGDVIHIDGTTGIITLNPSKETDL